MDSFEAPGFIICYFSAIISWIYFADKIRDISWSYLPWGVPLQLNVSVNIISCTCQHARIQMHGIRKEKKTLKWRLKRKIKKDEIKEHVWRSTDIRCVLAICPCTCLWMVPQMVKFHIIDTLLFNFSLNGAFLRNSARGWRNWGRTDRRTNVHTLL